MAPQDLAPRSILTPHLCALSYLPPVSLCSAQEAFGSHPLYPDPSPTLKDSTACASRRTPAQTFSKALVPLFSTVRYASQTLIAVTT